MFPYRSYGHGSKRRNVRFYKRSVRIKLWPSRYSDMGNLSVPSSWLEILSWIWKLKSGLKKQLVPSNVNLVAIWSIQNPDLTFVERWSIEYGNKMLKCYKDKNKKRQPSFDGYALEFVRKYSFKKLLFFYLIENAFFRKYDIVILQIRRFYQWII